MMQEMKSKKKTKHINLMSPQPYIEEEQKIQDKSFSQEANSEDGTAIVYTGHQGLAVVVDSNIIDNKK